MNLNLVNIECMNSVEWILDWMKWLKWLNYIIYFDDISIYGKDEVEHE